MESYLKDAFKSDNKVNAYIYTSDGRLFAYGYIKIKIVTYEEYIESCKRF